MRPISLVSEDVGQAVRQCARAAHDRRRWSAITRIRGRRSRTAAEENLNRLVQHQRGRYSRNRLPYPRDGQAKSRSASGMTEEAKRPSLRLRLARFAVLAAYKAAVERAEQHEVMGHRWRVRRARREADRLRSRLQALGGEVPLDTQFAERISAFIRPSEGGEKAGDAGQPGRRPPTPQLAPADLDPAPDRRRDSEPRG